ncbi:hypothetical protein MNBD_IGNAVI01-1161 [hydrothermal vent metagenome]|uniref:Glycosyltransferase 2-like domain-containing protein n=1 Tax=hydrothermal vent metagenome TaxID=652676 RepID=A0A3B1BKM4_9ZZZZ
MQILKSYMDNQLPNSIVKYLKKYAYDKWKIYGSNGKYKSIIVIPAIDELENIKTLLSSLIQNEKEIFPSTLILFVINHIVSSDADIKQNNIKTIEYLKNIIDKKKNEDELSRMIINSDLQIAFIDAASEDFELDDKEGGVGLARKIGMDEALKLFDYGSSEKNILICLDADCTVSRNYILTIRHTFDNHNIHAGYVNFAHDKTDDEENYKAIINYEIFLRYYVLALNYAKSPYAYHSIGSTMVCDVESYLKIQGMNKRKAAEDFYFMEKLSKITEIKRINETTVYPSSRGSWRVPFGTGKRVTRFLEKVQNEYLLYAPESFTILKKWNEVFYSDEILSAVNYLNNAKNISKTLLYFLIDNKFEENWNKILNNTRSLKQINKQKQLWFDGFKTLRLTHYLRDSEFPLINMFDALDELFSLMQIPFEYKNTHEEIPSIKIQEQYLTKLREIA